MMQFLLVAASIVGGMFASIALPWLVLGVATVYFNLFRRGKDMAWFDLPFFLALLVATALINFTTLATLAVIKDVIGVSPLPAQPDWRVPRGR
jgi:hypothetical protein